MCINTTPIYLRIGVILSMPLILGMLSYMSFKRHRKLFPTVLTVNSAISILWMYYWYTFEFLAKGC